MKINLNSRSTKPRRSIKDFRLWLGIIFVAISVILTQYLLGSATARTVAIIIKNPVPAGSALTENDLELAEVILPNYVSVISKSQLAVGQITTRDLFPGDVLTEKSLVNRKRSEMRLISTPIKAGHLPALTPGQLVDVWVTPSTDGMSLPGPATLVISQATIHAIPEFIDPAMDTSVTLLIGINEVSSIVQAMRDGVIDLVALPDNYRNLS